MDYPLEGGCICGHVRYRMLTRPLVVHCCHCRWCQRETGASFALNAMIESDRVEHLGAEPEVERIPSESGYGQQVARCPRCKTAIWSHYPGSGPLTRFVRVGTLDNPDALPPDVHVCTASKQPWVVLSGDVPLCEEFYERADVWREESLVRIAALQPEVDAYRATRQPMAVLEGIARGERP
ncbi:MAG: GFA family protein [Lysobacter sp.]